MAKSVKKVIRTVVVTVVVGAIVIAGAVAFQHRQQISDTITAQAFDASPQILALTENIELTPAGNRIFLASEPTLDSSQRFNEQCSKVAHADGGHVLGCYVASQIHLFDVTDERLAGIVEATAVHELLHATFARLSLGERDALVELLDETYAEISTNDRALVDRMSVYDGLSEVAYANELHSVLATEVRELPQELELHYAEWLTDRALIVEYFDASHHVFTELQEQAAQLESELTALREDIETRSANYDVAVAEFNDAVASFSLRNQNYEFSGDPDRFYAERSALDQRRAALNVDLEAINAAIASYDVLRAELAQLGELNRELLANLDSEFAPPASPPAL